MSRGLFVTGTSTGVGKTYVAALIARDLKRQGHRVGVYKPVASGWAAGSPATHDAEQLWQAAGGWGSRANVCPQRFAAALAPHLAAQAEGRCVDEGLLVSGIDYWRARSDIVVVEGAGGLLSPLGPRLYNADLAAIFGYPLVVVAANRLGVIGQSLQTRIAAAAWRGGLPVAGMVLCDVDSAPHDPSREGNLAELEARAEAPAVVSVGWGAEHFEPPIDWWQRAAAAPGMSVSGGGQGGSLLEAIGLRRRVDLQTHRHAPTT